MLRFVNERWQEITGFDADDALGRNWQTIIHPDDRAVMAEQWAASGALGQPFRGMVRVVRPDGAVRWVMSATEPLFDDRDTLTGHVGTLDDITERLTAQRDTERLSDIVEATSDLVVISDRENRLIYMNAAARRFFGLGPDASARGLRLHAVHAAVGPRAVPQRDPAGTARPRHLERRVRLLPRRLRGLGLGIVPRPSRRRRQHRVRLVGHARHQRAQGLRATTRVPGHPRPTHRPPEPHVVPRPARAGAWPAAAAATGRWRCCSATSTTSRS